LGQGASLPEEFSSVAIAPRLDDTDPALPALRLEAFPSASQTLLVLTRDAELLATLRNVPGHDVVAVASEADLAGQLMQSQGGVALVDAAAATTPITSLTERLKTQFPDLVLVVAGGTEDQGALTPQITRGMVYRFLHKPLSEQRVKLFVAAAWRRHGEEHSGIFAPARTQTTRTLPVLPRRKPWGSIIAVVVAIVAVAFWFLTRAPAPPVATSRQAAPPILRPALTQAETSTQPPDTTTPGVIAREPTESAPVQSPAPTQLPPSQTAVAERAAANLSPAPASTVAIPPVAAPPPAQTAAAERPAPKLSSAPIESAPSPLAARIVSEARNALAEGKVDEAERLIQIAAEAGVDEDDLDDLMRKATEQRIAARGTAMTRLSRLFNERLSQGKLLGPENDGAKYYLAQMVATDYAHPSTVSARDALNARFLQEARKAAAEHDSAGASRWLAEARNADADEKALANTESEIASARAAAAAAAEGPELVAAASLNKLRHVDPRYPQAARDRELAGWVDLEITVRSDGSVDDVTIVQSQPAEVFDQAAMDAVRQWRYEPVVRNGKAVAQRTRVRIRFQMQ
jgi:TonB family protein